MKILSILTHDPASVHMPGPEDYQKMQALIAEMKSNGALIDTGGAMPGSLEMRISRRNGKDAITDGPFAEAKEVVGGFALMDVASRDEAIEWTRRFLDLVGEGGTCELHEVSTA